MKTEWTPRNLGLGAAVLVSAVFLAPKLEQALPAFVRFLQTTQTAYAAKAEAEQTSQEFKAYLAEEQKSRELEQQSQALQQKFNNQLIQLQQQQVPVAAPPRIFIRLDKHGNELWCYEATVADCDRHDAWERPRP